MGGLVAGFCPPGGFGLGIGREIISALYVEGTIPLQRVGPEGMGLSCVHSLYVRQLLPIHQGQLLC